MATSPTCLVYSGFTVIDSFGTTVLSPIVQENLKDLRAGANAARLLVVTLVFSVLAQRVFFLPRAYLPSFLPPLL